MQVVALMAKVVGCISCDGDGGSGGGGSSKDDIGNCGDV